MKLLLNSLAIVIMLHVACSKPVSIDIMKLVNMLQQQQRQQEANLVQQEDSDYDYGYYNSKITAAWVMQL